MCIMQGENAVKTMVGTILCIVYPIKLLYVTRFFMQFLARQVFENGLSQWICFVHQEYLY
jgi:hypothetical protein